MSGLLFVLGECGSDLQDAEFNDWYDNEHGPARLTVPGFLNAIRYKATDSQTPTYAALYDLTSSSIAFSEPYQTLVANATPRDKSIIPRAQTLNRRVYEQIREPFVLPKANVPGAIPGKYIFCVSWRIQPELEDDFHKWYDEEHLSELSKVPGFIRARRYKLIDSAELGRTGAVTTDYRNPSKKHTEKFNYLVLYDLDRDDFQEHLEFAAAIQTPRSVKVMGAAEGLGIRRFGLHKVLEKK